MVRAPDCWALATALPSASTIWRSSSSERWTWAARARFWAAFWKLRAPWLSRQASSRAARLTVAWAASSQASAGHRPPVAGLYQRVRSRSMRSRAVRTLCVSRPLFFRRRPSGVWGGGKSRFRGIDFHLQGLLVDLLSEAGEQVTDLLLAVVDDLALGGSVDGVGDALAEFLEAATQGLKQGRGGERGERVHRCSGGWTKEKGRP